ncbi:hypothetical protein PHLGIDRAFT_120429 [Phlebiopsis gigantea 11061_1 CR5-6]|uniref:Uncharacterized protein n=1 Tax=Phlebiopsis gigantea (strain 11061_1 CR5-6) TaxID=745531 RepID=A0A0C3NIS0_PHLG1|nr:hypothetical protein PHLGIDRAFT_120429 [Phlebiopsis gigantea 11061_1 CR5-6]
MHLVCEVIILSDLYNFQSTGNADVLDLLARKRPCLGSSNSVVDHGRRTYWRDPSTTFTPHSAFGLRQLTDNLRVITASQAPTLTPVATPTSGVAASIHSPYRTAAADTATATLSTLSAALEGKQPSPIVSRVTTLTGFSVPSPPDASMIRLLPSGMPSLEPMGPPLVPTRIDPPLPRIEESLVSDESSRVTSLTPCKGEKRLTSGAHSTLDY